MAIGEGTRGMRGAARLRAALGTAFVLLVAACQAAPAATPGTQPPATTPAATAPATTAPPSPTDAAPATSAASPSQAPTTACDPAGDVEDILVFAANRGPGEFVLEITGADGACNWRVGASGAEGSVGAARVRAGTENTVRLRRASDCSVVGEWSAEAGNHSLEIRAGQPEFRPQQDVDLLPLGAAGPPCTPGG